MVRGAHTRRNFDEQDTGVTLGEDSKQRLRVVKGRGVITSEVGKGTWHLACLDEARRADARRESRASAAARSLAAPASQGSNTRGASCLLASNQKPWWRMFHDCHRPTWVFLFYNVFSLLLPYVSARRLSSPGNQTFLGTQPRYVNGAKDFWRSSARSGGMLHSLRLSERQGIDETLFDSGSINWVNAGG